MSKYKTEKRITRHKRIRSKVAGTTERPRLAVFKSNTNLSAQIIDDSKGATLAHAWTKNQKGKTLKERAAQAGKEIAEKALAKNIKAVVFDRGGFIYTGNLKIFADSAREAGLEF